MRIYSEMPLEDFEPEGMAVRTFETFKRLGVLSQLEEKLEEEYYPQGISHEELTRLFGYEEDYLRCLVGLPIEKEGEE